MKQKRREVNRRYYQIHKEQCKKSTSERYHRLHPNATYGVKNENNPMWKGDKVVLISLHGWVRRHKPKPKLREKCHQLPPYDLANISGKYLRNINDFQWICRKCHMLSDGRMRNLKQFQKGDLCV